ncbi:MAG: glycosyltransferase [Planctomycetes bacterium]|nr:glycosyltransferase [Chloroflexota bacterium]MBE3144979.1 glycosyltransferase [Planctomycetota bacterium]
MISVLIATINDQYLKRTLLETWKTAEGEVEFIVINDGGNPLPDLHINNGITTPRQYEYHVITHPKTLGRRVSFNEAARMARGDYLFILDSHCSMSQGWDTKMMASCTGNNLVYSVIRDMDKETWNYRPGYYTHVRLNKEYTEKWWNLKPYTKCEVEEESMTITGCAWMVTQKCYWELGGYDESLGGYGWDGPEWTCKVWMGEKPGRVILRTDVICGHIFGTNDGSKVYHPDMIPKAKYIEYMTARYGDKIDKLVEHFAPVPDWEPGLKGSNMGQTTKREVKVNRIDESVTKDEKGEVVKKVIEYFEYIYTDDGNGPSEAAITKKYGPKAKKVREEVWELKDGQLQKVA